MRYLFSLLCGLLFGSGLTISGMNDPARVQGFLDLAGPWDPTLAFVMVGALCVFGFGYFRWVSTSPQALCGDAIPPVPAKKLDVKLIAGAGIFGIGWGLAGICPGPAVTLLAAPSLGVLLFFASLVIGLWVGDWMAR